MGPTRHHHHPGDYFRQFAVDAGTGLDLVPRQENGPIPVTPRRLAKANERLIELHGQRVGPAVLTPYSPSLASEATKQSILACCSMDCLCAQESWRVRR